MKVIPVDEEAKDILDNDKLIRMALHEIAGKLNVDMFFVKVCSREEMIVSIGAKAEWVPGAYYVDLVEKVIVVPDNIERGIYCLALEPVEDLDP